MEARNYFLLMLIGVCLQLNSFDEVASAQAYQANSENFVVYAANRQLAQKASQLAEQYRKELSIDWLGYEIEKWSERCPIYIQVDRHAGGETSFAFVQNDTGRSEPISWQMKIFGPVDRLLDAVLPHEITHTIFATHFGRPLPRWADEGACTTVEHESERRKNHRMLIGFLTATPSRGIPFNRMFTMKQYPHDILPLYAQGYSVAKYLIGQKGRQHFVQYLEKGMSMEHSNHDTSAWDQATSEYYGYKDLSDLQLKWQAWVKSGSPMQSQVAVDVQIAQESVSVPPSFVDPRSTYAVAKNNVTVNPVADVTEKTAETKELKSWYARQSRAKQAVTLPSRFENDLQQSDPFQEYTPGSLKRMSTASGGVIDKLLNKKNAASATQWR